MINILRLVRYKNLLIVILTQYLIRYCIIKPMLEVNNMDLQFSNFNFLLLVIATVLITAGGYVINDYFDTKTDRVNRPDNMVIGTKINEDNEEEEHYRPMWGYHLKSKWFNGGDEYYEEYENALEIGLQKGLENLIIT